MMYDVEIKESRLFAGAYSYIQLDVSAQSGSLPPAYIRIPSSLANEPLVQQIFEPAALSPDQGKVRFNIFFPLPQELERFELKVFPVGTDARHIDDGTPGFSYGLDVSKRSNGSALMLYQENKEKNVRVYSTEDVKNTHPVAEYFWYGTTIPDLTSKIEGAVIHLTEETTTNLIDTASFEVAGEKLVAYADPSNGNKKHLYFFTDKEGLAKLIVRPGAQSTAARMVYWPFDDNSSEAFRIAVYDNGVYGPGLKVPVPVDNPVTVSDTPVSDRFRFTIPNTSPVSTIESGGKIYILVNGVYNQTIDSASSPEINFEINGSGLKTSASSRPESNTVSYIYVDRDGKVSASRKRSFFAFAPSHE